MTSRDSEACASQQLSDKMSDELKALGFEPGWPVMQLGGFDFGIDLIHEALIKSTYWRPMPVPFVYTQRVSAEEDEFWRLDMVPELVQALYEPFAPRLEPRAIGCQDDPKWYVRGRLFRGSFGAHPTVDRMHVLLDPMETQVGSTIDVCVAQLVRYERPDADPSAPLVRLDRSHAPGQD